MILESYEYGNARLKSMKSELFSRSDYERFISLPDLQQFFAALTDTRYRSDIEHALVRYPEPLVIAGTVRHHLTRKLQNVRSFYQEKAAANVDCYLERWDVLNLKTIFRGVVNKTPLNEIQTYIIAAGRLDEPACIELARQPDVKSVLDLLRAWQIPFAKDLSHTWSQFVETGSTAFLELALERFRYTRAFTNGNKMQTGSLHEAIASEIDIANLTALVILISSGQLLSTKERTELLVNGGQLLLSPAQMNRFIDSKTVEELVHNLRNTRYAQAVEGVPPHDLSAGNLEVLQRAFEKYLLRQGERMFSQDALGPGVLVGFERAIVAEGCNLRLIAQAKVAGLNREEIWNQLLIPFEKQHAFVAGPETRPQQGA